MVGWGDVIRKVYSLQMAEPYPLTHARSRLGELVKRAHYGRERVIITEHGDPVAALISIDDLAELQAAADTVDIAMAARIMAEGKPAILHHEVEAALDALDAADQLASADAESIVQPHLAFLRRVGYATPDQE